jgi:hypothetical protein
MARPRKFDSEYWIEHSGYSRVGFAAAVIREGVKDGVAWMVISQTGDPAHQIWLKREWLSIRDRAGRWIAASMPIREARRKKIWATKRVDPKHEQVGEDGIHRCSAERQAVKLSIHGNMQVNRRQTAFEASMNA